MIKVSNWWMMTMCKLHLIWRVILNLCTHPILLATSSRSESSPNPILYSDRGRPSKTLPVMFQLKSRVCLDRLHRGLIISISRAQLIVELVCANLRNCLVRCATKLFFRQLGRWNVVFSSSQRIHPFCYYWKIWKDLCALSSRIPLYKFFWSLKIYQRRRSYWFK